MKKYTKEKKQILQLSRLIAVVSVCFCLVIGCLFGSLFFIRPDKSMIEKRKLTEFPAFTFSSFLDGSFFNDISLWYSDTYPMRDTFIAMGQSFQKNFYGPQQKTMLKGGNKKGDDIPKSKKPIKTDKKVEDIPENFSFDQALQNQIMDGLYVNDGAAYSVYYFNQEAADTYANQVINIAAKKLKGISNVYSLLVPNNSIVLPNETLKNLGGSDMEQAMKYYYSLYDGATGIETVSTLKKHKDEYLYFKTDHHWTSLGAYYAYQNFCKEKGWKPHSLKKFKKMTFSPFLGTYYDELLLPEMEKNPDSVTAYIPNSTNDMTYWDENGQEIQGHVIEDVSSWNRSSGYYCFINGDQPLSIIDNPKKDDGSSCLFVKESYGNAFVPYLVDHYDKVYIADFRYTNINVVDFAKEKNITDVIFENNMSIIASTDVALLAARLVQ